MADSGRAPAPDGPRAAAPAAPAEPNAPAPPAPAPAPAAAPAAAERREPEPAALGQRLARVERRLDSLADSMAGLVAVAQETQRSVQRLASRPPAVATGAAAGAGAGASAGDGLLTQPLPPLQRVTVAKRAADDSPRTPASQRVSSSAYSEAAARSPSASEASRTRSGEYAESSAAGTPAGSVHNGPPPPASPAAQQHDAEAKQPEIRRAHSLPMTNSASEKAARKEARDKRDKPRSEAERPDDGGPRPAEPESPVLYRRRSVAATVMSPSAPQGRPRLRSVTLALARVQAMFRGGGEGGSQPGSPRVLPLPRTFRAEPEPDPTGEEVEAALSHDELPWFLLHPETPLHNAWDIFVLLLVLEEMLVVPYEASFGGEALPVSFDVIVTAGFILDLFVNLVTSFRDLDGELAQEWRSVAERYARSGWLFVDLFSCLPLDAMVGTGEASLFKMVKLLRMVRVGKIFKRMHDLLRASAFRLVRLILFILIGVHWAACGWNMVQSDSWERQMGLWDMTRRERYITCFYSAIQLLFRNLHEMPASEGEEIYASFMVVVGACVQASVFGSVAVLLAGFDEAEVQYQKRMIAISDRMQQLRLPDDIQRRVLEFYHALWDKQASLSVNPDDFIMELSSPLVSDIKLFLFRDMVRRIPFLRSGLVGSHIVEAIVNMLTTSIYLTDDMIIRKGESGDWMGFLGRGAKVAIWDPNSEERVIIRVLGFGDYVGEMALLFNVKRTADVQALTWLRLHKLSRASFQSVKKMYPEEGRIIELELERFRLRMQYQHAQADRDKFSKMRIQPQSPKSPSADGPAAAAAAAPDSAKQKRRKMRKVAPSGGDESRTASQRAREKLSARLYSRGRHG